MAFNMRPGRSPFQQTGRGIPSAFLQERTVTTVNKVTGNTTKEQASAEAKRKAEEALAADVKAKALGGEETRSKEASATYTVPGKKVEKFLNPKDAKAVAAWKNAPQKNKDQYKDQNIEVKETASATGTPPPPPPPPPATPKPKTNWVHTLVSQPFGGHESLGFSDDKEVMDEGDRKQRFDTSEYTMTTSKENKYEHTPTTPQEEKIMATGRYGGEGGQGLSPYAGSWKDKKNEPAGGGASRRATYLNMLESKIDEGTAKAAGLKAAAKERQAAAIEAKKAKDAARLAARTPANQLKNQSKNTPVKQMKAKAKTKTPAKMKKC